jgi:hypothetical protein
VRVKSLALGGDQSRDEVGCDQLRVTVGKGGARLTAFVYEQVTDGRIGMHSEPLTPAVNSH